SLGAYAAGVRDLLAVLGFERVSVAGHSFGGGIAMQFAYLFPEYVERMALISSGGLGREVHPMLRAAGLPGAGGGVALPARGGPGGPRREAGPRRRARFCRSSPAATRRSPRRGQATHSSTRCETSSITRGSASPPWTASTWPTRSRR